MKNESNVNTSHVLQCFSRYEESEICLKNVILKAILIFSKEFHSESHKTDKSLLILKFGGNGE